MTVKKVAHSVQAQIAAPAQQKKDQLTSAQPTLSADEIAAVDEMVDLLKIITPEVKAALKKMDEKKKYLASVALLKFPAKEIAVLHGTKGTVSFDVETHAREVKDMHGLIGAMKDAVGGYEKLLPFLKINLGDIDKVLSEAERKPFVGDAAEGSRKLKDVIAK